MDQGTAEEAGVQLDRQVSMVKDKYKDGAVDGMVKSEVRVGEN